MSVVGEFGVSVSPSILGCVVMGSVCCVVNLKS